MTLHKSYKQINHLKALKDNLDVSMDILSEDLGLGNTLPEEFDFTDL